MAWGIRVQMLEVIWEWKAGGVDTCTNVLRLSRSDLLSYTKIVREKTYSFDFVLCLDVVHNSDFSYSDRMYCRSRLVLK